MFKKITILIFLFLFSFVSAYSPDVTDFDFIRTGGDSGTGSLLGPKVIPITDRVLEQVNLNPLINAQFIHLYHNNSGTLNLISSTPITLPNTTMGSNTTLLAGEQYIFAVGNTGGIYTRSFDTAWAPVSDSFFNVVAGVCVTYSTSLPCGYTTTTQYNIESIVTSLSLSNNIFIDNPIEQFNYTFDVLNLPINVRTDFNASCRIEYNDINTSLSITNGLSHNGTFNLGASENLSRTYNSIIHCQDLTNTSMWFQEPLQFYRQQEPIDLEILVPQDQQIFMPLTEQINFHLVTNYIAVCNYNVNNVSSQFTNTNFSVHTTLFNITNSSVLTYNAYFWCDAVNFVESVNKSVTFFLDELVINNINGGFAQVQQLTQESFGIINVLTSAFLELFTGEGALLNLIILSLLIGFVVGFISLLGIFIKSFINIKIGGKR